MNHPRAHPIRCWYVSVVIQRRVDCSASTIKVCKRSYLIFNSTRYFTYTLCLTLFMSLMLSIKLTDCSTACLPPSSPMQRSWWQAKSLKSVGDNSKNKKGTFTRIQTRTVTAVWALLAFFVLDVGPILTWGIVALWRVNPAVSSPPGFDTLHHPAFSDYTSHKSEALNAESFPSYITHGVFKQWYKWMIMTK